MKSFVSILINPLPIFFFLLIIGGILHWKKRKRSARIWGLVALFWLVLVSTPFTPNLLVRNLENKYPPLSDLNPLLSTINHCNILVLGGGFSTDVRLQATNKLVDITLVRLSEAIRIYHKLPGSYIITSGAKGRGEIPQSSVVAEAAITLGVDASRILQQEKPGNTWEEAREYKKRFGDTTRLFLVTSASHMPRAMALFRRAGLNPIPAPTNHYLKINQTRNPLFWMPKGENIKKMEAAIHEYAGMVWYRLAK